MNAFIHSIASTFHSLFRRPGFAGAVILTLTLGIGANTATLSLLYGYLLAPLPYPHAGQLVSVNYTSKTIPGDLFMSYPTYFDLRKQTTAMTDAGMYRPAGFNLHAGNRVLHTNGAIVSSSLFSTLGVYPLLGQVFGPAADSVGAAPQVVLSYRLWSQEFNSDPAILGQSVQLDGKAYTVTGVMPRTFQFPDPDTALWLPKTFVPASYAPANVLVQNDTMIARLKPGVSVTEFNAQAQSVVANEISHYPTPAAIPYLNKYGFAVVATPLRTALVGTLSQRLILVQLATGLLLLLVWFNVANLFIARALNRRSELVLRRVLGADTCTLFRQLFSESLMLCVLGAIAGLILGEVLMRILLHSGFGTSQVAFPLDAWGIAIGIAAVLAVVSALVFSLAGLYFIRRQDLGQALREGDARSSGGQRERRIRAGLVITQLVLACILVGVGAMLAHSLMRLGNVKLGFQPDHLITFQINIPGNADASTPGQALEGKLAPLRQSLAQVPGVSAVTISSNLPFDGATVGDTVFPFPFDGKHTPNIYPVVTDPGYFKTLDISLLAGRSFLPQDANSAEGYAVVDAMAAEDLFGTANAVGRQFSFVQPDNLFDMNKPAPGLLFRIIGVVGTAHRLDVATPEKKGSIYLDRAQVLLVKNSNWLRGTWYVAVRTSLSTAAVLPALDRAVTQSLANVPMYNVRTMDERLSNQLAPRRGLMTLVLMFALGAVLLAAVGLYAMQSYAVSQRLREFGIRAALGADRGQLLGLVLREIARLLVIGLVVGLVGVVVFGHVFSSAFYNVNMADPVSLFLVFVILSFTALAAGWIPAWRASRVPPMEALRER